MSIVKKTRKIMDTPQPNTVIVKGVEVPSYYIFWKRTADLQETVKLLRRNILFLSGCVVILAIGLLLK